MGGSLSLEGTPIQSLPDGLKVNGSLTLINCTNLKSLPENLIVNGRLDIEGCKNITSLPSGLKVKDDLDLRDTNITKLPPDLQVGDDLILYRTPLAKKYTEEELENMGYDVFMILIYVSPMTSLTRNAQRGRSLPTSAVLKSWANVINNIEPYRQLFGNNIVVDVPEAINLEFAGDHEFQYLANSQSATLTAVPDCAATNRASGLEAAI